jgi:hypothetical protein
MPIEVERSPRNENPRCTLKCASGISFFVKIRQFVQDRGQCCRRGKSSRSVGVETQPMACSWRSMRVMAYPVVIIWQDEIDTLYH